MTFKLGDSKPENSGRKKGTPNKKTLKFLEAMSEHDFDFLTELIRVFNESDTHGQRSMLLKMIDFIYPKFRSTEVITDEAEKSQTIEEYILMKKEERRLGRNNLNNAEGGNVANG